MTSKHCFFKVMREDLRHKTWMLVLSVLGNMLAILVFYLLSTGDSDNASVYSIRGQIYAVKGFFGIGVTVAGGIIAGAGALIVGLAGFRYVFHRNMVDTYHSIPVNRRTLFMANWLNGFLIWFVPCLISMGLALLLGVGRLSALRKRMSVIVPGMVDGGDLSGGGLVADALISLLTLAVVFLLVYHLVLLAVMLCGNVLNTLVTTATLGVGVISVYGLAFAFCILYLDTFLAEAVTSYRNVVYASPLASAVVLMYRRCVYHDGGSGPAFWIALLLNLAIAFVLGALALLTYLRRPSELAEQGLRNRPVKYVMQHLISLGAAMGGWLVFSLITEAMGESAKLAWGIFGALLAGVLAFGVMDIIFRMEFKAFFAHKVRMAVAVAAGVLIGFTFTYDWMGYDEYLPDREDIAEIAVYGFHNSNGNFYRSFKDPEHPLNRVSIRDRDAAYAFLKTAVHPTPVEETDRNYSSEVIYAKVTLGSGRVYYREYQVTHADREPAAALLTSPEYMNVNYRIDPADYNYDHVTLGRSGEQVEVSMGTPEGAALFKAVCEAYNRDLEENPSAFLYGDGRMLCRVCLYPSDYAGIRYLDVYEGMEHTVQALRARGYDRYAEFVSAEEVEKIRLGVPSWYYYGREDLMTGIMDCYGVWLTSEDSEAYMSDRADPPAPAGAVSVETASLDNEFSDQMIELWIDDPEEIRELLGLISYVTPIRSYNAFQPDYTEDAIQIDMTDGRTVSAVIPGGVLPEKYIRRFRELLD